MISTYSMKGKEYMWWEYLKSGRGLVEKEMTWDKFENLFREKNLSKHYYDGEENCFYELKMGKMADDEYITKFLELLRYVPYLKDQKANIKGFISGFPMTFRDRIELLEPHTLENAIKN